jgi:hypothetical protein
MKDKIIEILESILTAEHSYDENGRLDFVDGIEEAAQAIVDQLGLGWINAEERLPEEKTPVLVDNGSIFTAFYYKGSWYWYPIKNKAWSFIRGVKNWMPLPNPPKDCEAK